MSEERRPDERWDPLPGLRRARRDRLLSRPELAKLAGVAVRTIVSLETGQSRARPATIRKLAAALGVAPRELMTPGEEQPPAGEPTDGGNTVTAEPTKNVTAEEG